MIIGRLFYLLKMGPARRTGKTQFLGGFSSSLALALEAGSVVMDDASFSPRSPIVSFSMSTDSLPRIAATSPAKRNNIEDIVRCDRPNFMGVHEMFIFKGFY